MVLSKFGILFVAESLRSLTNTKLLCVYFKRIKQISKTKVYPESVKAPFKVLKMSVHRRLNVNNTLKTVLCGFQTLFNDLSF